MRHLLRHPLHDLRHPVETLKRPTVHRTVMWLLALALIGGLISSNRAAIDASHREADERAAQFCHLINSTHADKARRYAGALAYLRSPAGRERTLLNAYVRKVSLPQTRVELAQEARALPPVCRKKRPRA